MQPVMIPSPDPSMGPGGMMNVPGLNEPQWGSNVGVVTEDPEMTRNRQFGYAVMACAVVALAVLMVSLSWCIRYRSRFLCAIVISIFLNRSGPKACVNPNTVTRILPHWPMRFTTFFNFINVKGCGKSIIIIIT